MRFARLAPALIAIGCVVATAAADATGPRSITDVRVQLPSLDQVIRVLSLRDYNTAVVVIGVTCLGIASGLIGSFMLLRKRALLGDALSHATLPGVGIAFLVMTAFGAEGKWLPGLLIGGAISGGLGVLGILAITKLTRLTEDAALGIVLSVFFGIGVAVLGVVQKVGGNAAGLESFIYGKTASMLFSDAATIAIAGGAIAMICIALIKELTLLCFDSAFAASQGWPTLLLDTLLMVFVVGVTIIGLQAVGLILMIALLIIPAAAARFWTERLTVMLIGAAVIGGVSGAIGAAISALAPRLPAGAIIVLVAGAAFLFSMICGPTRGVIARAWRLIRLQRRIGRQHLLRAMYELSEEAGANAASFTTEQIHGQRYWAHGELRAAIRAARRAGEIDMADDSRLRLSPRGREAAWRVTRNHRLWELFMVTHADIAPSHVDRDADAVEHVLDPAMVRELEAALSEQYPDLRFPPKLDAGIA
ncbi:MAG: metal ABC transporter permease [Phycisphaerales bacterium]|nr:metal ABC transporter permease [Phycisphaerales bacterium]